MSVIGWIASLYGIYLAIVGVREVHSTTGKAAIAVRIPALIVLFLPFVLVVLVRVTLFFGAQR